MQERGARAGGRGRGPPSPQQAPCLCLLRLTLDGGYRAVLEGEYLGVTADTPVDPGLEAGTETEAAEDAALPTEPPV